MIVWKLKKNEISPDLVIPIHVFISNTSILHIETTSVKLV